MGLDTPDKDGKTLSDRFDSRFLFLINTWQVISTESKIHKLFIDALRGNVTPYQEQLGRDLVAIAARQFEREQRVCFGVAGLVYNAPNRFLEEFPGLKERVFETDIDDAVIQKDGLFEEGRMLSHLVMHGFDLTPPTHDDFTLPRGILFAELDGELVKADPAEFSKVDKSARGAVLAEMPNNLSMFWVQQFDEQAPHPLIPRRQRI